MLAVVWVYAVNHELVAEDMSAFEARVLTRRLTPGGGGHVVLVIVGLFAPIVAVFGYLLIAFGLMIPVRGPDRRRSGRRPRG